jgi:hypothetical protein
MNANVLYHSRKLRSQPRSANFDIVACKYGRRTEAVSANLRHRNVKVFIPIYPNTLPTVPKRSRASLTASLVFSNLPASRCAITRLENRWTRKGLGGSNPSSSATKYDAALELEGLPFRLRRVIALLLYPNLIPIALLHYLIRGVEVAK